MQIDEITKALNGKEQDHKLRSMRRDKRLAPTAKITKRR